MRSTSYVSWCADEITETVNDRYDQLLEVLVVDGVISAEQQKEIEQYRCIVSERNLFGKLWEKMFEGKKENSWVYIVQKFAK